MEHCCHNILNFIPFKTSRSYDDSFIDLIKSKIDINDLGKIDERWFDSSLTEETDSVCLNDENGNNSLNEPFQSLTNDSKVEQIMKIDNPRSSFIGKDISQVSPIHKEVISESFFSPKFSPTFPENFNNQIPCSTPKSLPASLGVIESFDEHVWKSSMETPLKEPSITGEDTPSIQYDEACSINPVNLNLRDDKVNVNENVSKDVLEFLIATPPSRKAFTKKQSKKKVWFSESDSELSTPVRKKSTLKPSNIFNKSPVSKNLDNSTLRLSKMIYPSEAEIREYLPSKIYNLNGSSDDIINNIEENILKDHSQSFNDRFDNSQLDQISWTQFMKSVDSQTITSSPENESSFCKDDALSSEFFAKKECSHSLVATEHNEQLISNSENTEGILKLVDMKSCESFDPRETLLKAEKLKEECDLNSDEQFDMNSFDVESSKLYDGECKNNSDFLEIRKKPMFATASGKSLQVSEKALLKVKRMVTECFNDNADMKEEPMFATANGKCIQVSKKAKELAEECDLNSNSQFNVNSFDVTNKRTYNASKSSMADSIMTEYSDDNKYKNSSNFAETTEKPMFANASGKNVKVSEKALLKAEQLISESDSNSYNQLDYKPSFAFASGKEINLSKEALCKAKNAMSEFYDDSIGQNEMMKMKKRPDSKYRNSSKFAEITEKPMFAKASGKSVKVYEKALLKAKELISESDSNSYNRLDSKPSFAFASGKEINLSKEALSKAKNAMSEFYDDSIGQNEMMKMKKRPDNEYKNSFNRAEITEKPMFANASGKSVKVSEKALLKAEQLISESNSNSYNQLDYKPSFAFASGKEINLSKEALSKAKNAMSEFYDDSIGQNEMMKMKKRPDNEYKNSFNCAEITEKPMFANASGKSVKVSEKALLKAEQLISESDSNSYNQLDSKSLFVFASGKEINLSKEALSKAKNAMSEFYDDSIGQNEVMKMKKRPDNEYKNSFNYAEITEKPMFANASGKSVKISEKALLKAEQLISECDSNSYNQLDYKPSFAFASGKEINLSKEALSKAKNAMSEFYDDSIGQNEMMKMKKRPDNEYKNSFNCAEITEKPMFANASGKSVKVSEKALLKAEQLISECDSNSYNQLDYKPSFAFASGKEINLSKEALSKAKDAMSEFYDDCIGQNEVMKMKKRPDNEYKNSFNCAEITEKPMFATASGKSVKVSEQVLIKAKQLISESDCNSFDQLDSKPLFAFASGKEINVSKEALSKAKSVMSELYDDSVESNSKEMKIDNRPVFATASGKSVEISKEAFSDAKKVVSKFHGNSVGPNDFKELKMEERPVFATASGKSVNVSETAFIEANALMSESTNNSISNIDTNFISSEAVNISKESPNLLPSANGQKMNISEKALLQSKEFISQKDGSLSYIHSNSKCSPVSDNEASESLETSSRSKNYASEFSDYDTGNKFDHRVIDKSVFATASGMDITVSEKALFESKKIISKSKNSKNCSILKSIDKMSNSQKQSEKKPLYASVNDEIISGSEKTLSKTKILVSEISQNDKDQSQSYSLIADEKIKLSTNQLNASYDENKAKKLEDVTESNKDMDEMYSHDACNLKQLLPRTTQIIDTNCKTKLLMSNSDKAENLIQNPIISNADSDLADRPFDALICCSDNESGVSVNHVQKKRLLECAVFPPSKRTYVSYQEYADQLILYQRKLARLKQDSLIDRKSYIKPTPGAWINKSNNKKLKMKDLFHDSLALSHSIKQTGLNDNVQSRNAAEFRFTLNNHFKENIEQIDSEMYSLGDQALLVLADDNTAGKHEFYRAFLTIESVDQKLFSEDWFYNHYRWIIWKLACYDKIFYKKVERCLTPGNVMLQLKYRYDREIDKCQRSALKKIFERDETPFRRMVLMVSQIFDHRLDAVNSVDVEAMGVNFSLELSDGWYSIPAIVDEYLSKIIENKKIDIGQKLMIFGSELIGSDEAFSPLDAPSHLKLRICSNGTRRAKWHEKLGFCRIPNPFQISMKSIVHGGGNIACLSVLIARVYPQLYVERYQDKSSVFRVRKAEEEVKRKHEALKEEYVQKVMKKIEDESFSSSGSRKRKRSKIWSIKQIKKLESIEDISIAFEEASDPDMFLSLLDDDQKNLLHDYRMTCKEKEFDEVQMKFQNALQEDKDCGFVMKRNVSILLRLRLIGCHPSDTKEQKNCVLSVWNPSPDLEDLLKEGTALKIFNIIPSATQKRKKNRQESLGLVASSFSKYEKLELDSRIKNLIFRERHISSIAALTNKEYNVVFKEVDLVFVILDIINSSVANQTVYISDFESSIAALKFPGGPKVCGAEDLITPGTVICAFNLHLEPYLLHKNQIPCLVASDISKFSTNPGSKCHQSAYQTLSALCTDECFQNKCKERWSSIQDNFLSNLPRTPIKSMSPNAASPFSTPGCSSAHQLQSRLSRLQSYGSPPVLPPINSSIGTNRKFKTPTLRSRPGIRRILSSNVKVNESIE